MSLYTIGCICTLLASGVGCLFAIVKQGDIIDSHMRSIAALELLLTRIRRRLAQERDRTMQLDLALAKMTSKHDKASRMIAELMANERAESSTLVPITPGWYETRDGGRLEVIAVSDGANSHPVTVRLEERLIENYHSDGIMCHNTGPQACDLVRRVTAQEGGAE